MLSDNADGLCRRLMAGGTFCTSQNSLQMVTTSMCCQRNSARPQAQDAVFYGEEGDFCHFVSSVMKLRGCVFTVGTSHTVVGS